jgi:peptidyl-prolyl cis-trans isomerase B (cyclophilin B)
MNPAVNVLAALFSVLVPQKMWYASSQPIVLNNQSKDNVTLVMTEFNGAPVASVGSSDLAGGRGVNLRALFPTLAIPGVYILCAQPQGTPIPAKGMPTHFLGTPLVIDTVADPHPNGIAPLFTRIIPLQYAVIKTAYGDLKAIFYYDVAPHTVDNFLMLASEGFYDGLTFHRIVPGFVIQSGDPTQTGTGFPGYHIDAEFNDKPHLEGVLSMARMGDPNEDSTTGVRPRAQFANSGASQFFICLDYKRTRALDHLYTAFGRVIQGMDAARKIAAIPLSNTAAGTPAIPQKINTIEVFNVTEQNNPYADIGPATQPSATQPLPAAPSN